MNGQWQVATVSGHIGCGTKKKRPNNCCRFVCGIVDALSDPGHHGNTLAWNRAGEEPASIEELTART